MTDLPQLQQALVGAARRRNRFARARSALVGLATLVAVIVVAATALDGREREIEAVATPQPTTALTARAAADRFAILRDESRLAKPSSNCHGPDAGPGSQTYLVRRQGGISFCATIGQQGIWLSAASKDGYSGGDVPSEDFAEGRIRAATVAAGDGDLVYAIVPDGTRDARLTYRDGTTESVPIEDNFLGVVADKPAATVSWTTPDGQRFTTEP